jgi:predicted amidohydrolase
LSRVDSGDLAVLADEASFHCKMEESAVSRAGLVRELMIRGHSHASMLSIGGGIGSFNLAIARRDVPIGSVLEALTTHVQLHQSLILMAR